MKNDINMAQSQETFAQRSARKNYLRSLVIILAMKNDINLSQSQETFAQRSARKNYLRSLGKSSFMLLQ